MKSFTVYFDQKVTVWSRTKFLHIEAESKEEAVAKAKEKFNEQGDIDDYEILYDTEHQLSPGENNGNPTEEWLVDGETIETNGE